MKIISVWESPTSDVTESFSVGMKAFARGWTVGEIRILESTFYVPPPDPKTGEQKFVALESTRIEICDAEGKRRVTLPYEAVGLEYGAEEKP